MTIYCFRNLSASSAMEPVPVFDPDNGATWLQTSDAVTITVPLGEKPLVSIHPQRLEVEVATGGAESKILDHELFAQVWLKRSGPGGLFEAFWVPQESKS